MKKVKRLSFIFILAITVLMIADSCKKSSTNSSAITKENLAGTYGLTSLTVTIAPFPPQDILDSVPACQRDDLYKLNVDLTYNYIDAGTKCNPPGDGSGKWSLSGNILTIDTTQGTIQKFDGKTLVLNTAVSYNGISGTTTETLTKQ